MRALFAGISVQARKTVKADEKPMVDELNTARDKWAEDHGANERAEEAKGGHKKWEARMKKCREKE